MMREDALFLSSLRLFAHQVALYVRPPEKKTTGEQFFQKAINSDCWLQIKKHLSARDILALRHTCSFLLSGQMPLLCPGQNQALVNVLVERYYNRNQDVQSLCRQIMTPYFTRIHEHKSAFCNWVEKNLGEQEQIWIGKDVLRQGSPASLPEQQGDEHRMCRYQSAIGEQGDAFGVCNCRVATHCAAVHTMLGSQIRLRLRSIAP